MGKMPEMTKHTWDVATVHIQDLFTYIESKDDFEVFTILSADESNRKGFVYVIMRKSVQKKVMPKTIYVTHDGKHPRYGWRGLFRKKKLDGPIVKSMKEAMELVEPGTNVFMEDGLWTGEGQVLPPERD